MAFLTLEDPNAKIKGSRDPLGMVPIWSRFARHVVTNLTTPSGSVRGFTILILGRYFAEHLIETGRIEKEDALDVVLRMEQLGAYARHVGHQVEGDIRGIERVKAFIRNGKGSIIIQSDKTGQILADQKVYGLWGLFSVPARSSGLIPDGPVGVSYATQEFIKSNYLPILLPELKPLLTILANGGRLNLRKSPEYFNALITILSEQFTLEEISFYGSTIRDAHNHDHNYNGRQALFSQLLVEHNCLTVRTSREEILSLAKKAHKKDTSLERYLLRIADLEAILAPADALFNHMLMFHNQPVEKIAKNIKDVWGRRIPYLNVQKITDLLPEIQESTSEETGAALVITYKALAAGQYKDAIKGLLQWNQTVMAGRQSAPWINMGENGRLDVRYRGADQYLPDKKLLHELWRNSYFIDSLKRVNYQLLDMA